MIPLLDGENSKVCRLCKTLKHTTEFHINKTCKLGVIGTCKLCYKLRIDKWYQDNRERRQDYSNTKNRTRKREWVSRLGDQCLDCGKSFPDYVYDFHHTGGKDVNPSKALTWSPTRAEAEITKCVLLCSNCHRIRHFGGGTFNDTTH